MVYRSSSPPPAPPYRVFGMKPLRVLRYLYLRLVRLQATPAEIARGLSIGVFAGMFPAFGFQTVVSILLATLIRGNKLAAAAATWVSNPLTYVPIYAFNFQVGKRLLGARSLQFQFTQSPSFDDLTQMGADFVVVMLSGSFVVGAIAAVLAYIAAIPTLRAIKRRLHKHH